MMNATIAQLLQSQPLDSPGLAGLLDAIRDTAAELGELARQEGDDAVLERLGEIPAFHPEFRAWADEVLDPTPAGAVLQADGDPAPVEAETARARAIREAAEAEQEAVDEADGMPPPPEDVEVEVEVDVDETARARAIREAAEALLEDEELALSEVEVDVDVDDVPVEHARERAIRLAAEAKLVEGTDVPFPTAAADASGGSSSGGDSADVSGEYSMELDAIKHRLDAMATQLGRVDQVTADSLGGIRDRLRKLEGRPGVPPVTEPPTPTDGEPIALDPDGAEEIQNGADGSEELGPVAPDADPPDTTS